MESDILVALVCVVLVGFVVVVAIVAIVYGKKNEEKFKIGPKGVEFESKQSVSDEKK